MRELQFERDIPLNLREIQQLRRWYRVFAADRSVDLTPNDLVLDAKLAYNQADMEARIVVRGDAIRERCTTRRFRHTGVERRSREKNAVIIATPPKRMVRYVLSTH